MACRAITYDLKMCRNWSVGESGLCSAHQDYTEELHKERWVDKHILCLHGTPYTSYKPWVSIPILRSLLNQEIVLTKEDIARIPAEPVYLDIFVLLIEWGFAKPSDNPSLTVQGFRYFLEARSAGVNPVRGVFFQTLTRTLLLSSGAQLGWFFLALPNLIQETPAYEEVALREMPLLLDTNAAKELCWWSKEALDGFRKLYELELGAEHPLTRALVGRWLLDLKELYVTEKQIQKIKMDACKEELMMNRWHPRRVSWCLKQGLDIEDM